MVKPYFLDKDLLIKIVGPVMTDVLIWTAVDVRRNARASMKQANKTRTNKKGVTKQVTGAHSKPGEAPYYRKGTIRDLILYALNAVDMSAVIGPKGLPGRKSGEPVPGILEHGGEVRVTTRHYRPLNRRKFSSEGERDKNVNKQGETRAGRPDRVNQTYEKKYRYFYSRRSWEKAKESEGFQAWGGVRQWEEETTTAKIAQRPFMLEALRKAIDEENMAKKVRRAMEKAMKRL